MISESLWLYRDGGRAGVSSSPSEPESSSSFSYSLRSNSCSITVVFKSNVSVLFVPALFYVYIDFFFLMALCKILVFILCLSFLVYSLSIAKSSSVH
jgi:hypothetical protein